MNLHEKLKYSREAAGLSLQEASEKSGLDATLIMHFENGKQGLWFHELSRLADAYCQDVMFLLSETSPEKMTYLWDERK